MSSEEPAGQIQAASFAFVSAFLEELARSGVQHACICPGSRSTPLAMLLERHPAITVWMHVDERSAAFFGLGLAKQLRQPVAILSTSGTATAEFHPAVVEARYGRVPLLVLTADRPPELQEVGAPQTIGQHRIYGDHVKAFFPLALPEIVEPALRSIRGTACRAVALALDAPAGPVHLNFPFREPLIPLPGPLTEGEAFTGRANGAPYTAVPQSQRSLGQDAVEALARELAATERGLIVCGAQEDESFPAAVARLATATGYPILADPLSLVRCGRHDRSLVLDAYDAFLRDARLAALAPQLVLRFGAMPTSKPLLQFLERHDPRQIVVDDAPEWRDPTLRTAEMVWAEPRTLCEQLCAYLDAGRTETELQSLPRDRAMEETSVKGNGGRMQFAPTEDGGKDESAVVGIEGAMNCAATEDGWNRGARWPEAWCHVDRVTREAIQRFLCELEEPFEGAVFADLADALPEGCTLFAGSSMPVRDLDTFFPGSSRHLRFLSNRGANGIDGVVSSALGASAGARGPVYLAIGDLSLYHDLNGLLAASQHQLDLTVILLNNDGGGIFSFLPQAAYPEQFETLFGTPTGLDFEPAVRMYGGRFERVSSKAALREALARPPRGLRVVEVRTGRARNVALHRAVWSAVSGALCETLAAQPAR